jgi:hypothetical protein
MSNLELVLNLLAEATSIEISKQKAPITNGNLIGNALLKW